MKRPTTDALIVVLHWAVAGAALVSALSGFRIAADDPGALLSVWISPITLDGGVHVIHFWSSVVLAGVAAAYLAYLVKSGAFGTFSVPRGATRSASRRVRLKVSNIRLYQLTFLVLGALIATGLCLYFGWRPFGLVTIGVIATMHVAFAWALVAVVLAHIVFQYMFGATAGTDAWARVRHGVDWLLKMLRPRRGTGGALVQRTKVRAQPLTVLAAGAGALTAGGGLVALDGVMHEKLDVVALGADPAPTLDGLGDEAVWARAPVASVVTSRGANLAGGDSLVEVQAATDGRNIYFRFRWQDATRSYTHLPLQKTGAGWRLLHTDYDIEDENVFYEDKFAVLLTTWSDIGGAVTHMGSQPLDGHPGGLSDRGLHYTTDGSIADMWQWKAVRSQPLGGLDDDHFGPPAEPKPDEIAGRKRYKGGYVTDPGSIASANNFAQEGPGGYRGEVLPAHLPTDLAALQARLGPIELNPTVSDTSPVAMLAAETTPYSPEADAAIPVGTVIPGIVLGEGGIEGDRGDVRTGARWEDGWWTLETARALDTGSSLDTAFLPGRSVFMWVAVFDRTQTRHSRHMRPLLIRLPADDAPLAQTAPTVQNRT